MNTSLCGKKIWLIGASEGIGRSLAIQLDQVGALLALSARNESALKELASSLVGTTHIVAPCDVRSEENVDEAFSKIIEVWHNFDILIYNAGYYEPVTSTRFDLSAIESMLDINLRGALRALKKTLPHFLVAHAGHIALVGSIAGYRGLPNALGYGASKAAMIHLAENLVCDLKNTGIKIQIINPGFVRTRLTDKNNFVMPQIMTPERAASFIIEGLQTNKFEIRFPWLFSTFLKWTRLMPDWLYFKLIKLH